MGLFQRLKNHPIIVVSAALLGALALLAGLLNDSLGVLDHLRSDVQPSSSAALPTAGTTASNPSRPTVPPVASTSEPADNGVCRLSTWVKVGCEEDHTYEALDGSCDAGGVVAFAGGVPGRDVLTARVENRDEQCWVRLLTSRQGTVRDVLLDKTSGVGLRACVDEISERVVGCDRLHSGEYLATGETSRSASDRCEAAASEYMKRQLADVDDILRVRAVSHPERAASAPRCVIEVRGGERLTTSLFALGTDAVPVEG